MSNSKIVNTTKMANPPISNSNVLYFPPAYSDFLIAFMYKPLFSIAITSSVLIPFIEYQKHPIGCFFDVLGIYNNYL